MDGGTVLMQAGLAGGSVWLDDSSLVFDLPGHGAPGPINAKIPNVDLHLEGASDVIGIGDVTDLQFDPATNTLLAYFPYRGQPYEMGAFHLAGTYTADEFSIVDRDIVYRAPGPGGIAVVDTTSGHALPATLSAYDGPVAGLSYQYVNTTADNLNITATTPNMFIRGGSGMDGIDVSQVNGNNILDGGGGSNFLTGGTGNDTFYVDARSADANVWSTVVNFHSGENVTEWGVTTADFTMHWIGDTYGASGYTGLTGVEVPNAGGAQTAVTLSGYHMADLTNGRLAITNSSINGTPYLSIHAN